MPQLEAALVWIDGCITKYGIGGGGGGGVNTTGGGEDVNKSNSGRGGGVHLSLDSLSCSEYVESGDTEDTLLYLDEEILLMEEEGGGE